MSLCVYINVTVCMVYAVLFVLLCYMFHGGNQPDLFLSYFFSCLSRTASLFGVGGVGMHCALSDNKMHERELLFNCTNTGNK